MYFKRMKNCGQQKATSFPVALNGSSGQETRPMYNAGKNPALADAFIMLTASKR